MNTNVATDLNEFTAEMLIERAKGLREMLRKEQDEAEQLGRYTEEAHQAMLDAGLYHIMTPKKYGGLELDVKTFLNAVVEISRGDPGSGWCYALGHGHALTTAALWSGEAQDSVYTVAPYFRASHSLRPSGSAKPVEGGYIINARSGFQSGVPYATHATVCVTLEQQESENSQLRMLQVLVPADKFEILDDWGGDATLGMRASGSNTVLVEEQFVPESYAVELDWLAETERSTSPGAEFHDNSLYLGVSQTFLQAELIAIVVGTARAAIDEYEETCRTKTSALPPFRTRMEDPGYQRDFGSAKIKTDTAELILYKVADLYHERSEAAFRAGKPFTRAMDIEHYGMLTQAGELAAQAVEELYRTSGASAALKGSRMERYFRDVSMARSHTSMHYGPLAQRIGSYNFGLVNSIF